LEWLERGRPIDPEWRLEVSELEVTLTRTPAVQGKLTRSWTGRLTEVQRRELDAALEHFGAREMPESVFVGGPGGSLSMTEGDKPRTVAFSSSAQESCEPEHWLRFPPGAATRTVELCTTLVAAVYGTRNELSEWHPPPCEGRPAGQRGELDERLLLSYAATEPHVVDSRRRYRETTWYLSGRVCCRTVLVDDDSGRTSAAPVWESRVSLDTVQCVVDRLRKSGFFASVGTMTGTQYDGEEVVACHFRGARFEKMLSYEVEMGARCGLSAAENDGLERIRGLEREAELARSTHH